MSFDPTWLFVSLFPGSIGLVLLAYGRKQGRWPQVLAGVLLMAYPYFTPTTPWLAGVGVLIGAGLWTALRLGW